MSDTLTKHQGHTISAMVKRMVVVGLGLASGACVNVSAPDKPIVINLNISVTQEVVYRLDNEAKSLIKQNPGIF
ncbi:YnbE family lipoprotein [Sphingomonas dokdonensis]|uniref:YnbE-like lipoprotein n=1 Tax=Sphingomonas dokdonensis TaxID=344880 RepID=A0A245ZP31_9SPHN|nr:hypothetical protein SPDO_15020 [Sphingomonas dokdonensis]